MNDHQEKLVLWLFSRTFPPSQLPTHRFNTSFISLFFFQMIFFYFSKDLVFPDDSTILDARKSKDDGKIVKFQWEKVRLVCKVLLFSNSLCCNLAKDI